MKFVIFYYLLYTVYFLTQKFIVDTLHLYFLNVGQGDSIIVRSKNTLGLIDGGPDYSLDYSVDNKVPFFSCRFNYILATHPHSDHIAGLARILKRCHVDSVLMNYVPYSSKGWNSFLTSAEERSRVYSFPNLPRSLSQDYLVKYFAADKSQCNRDVNICSLILKLDFGGVSILFTGDTYAHNLQELQIGHIDILKAPHHGGKNTLSQSLLTELSPKLAILSYGERNKYGHPADQTVELLTDFNVTTLHTLYGDVLVKVPR